MREIALATGVSNKEIIEFLHTNIKTKIDFCKTVITTYSDNNFSYLLFACDEQYIEPVESILKDIIIDYIESCYKVNYLKNHIKNQINDVLVFNAFIKVLALFDKTTDESALKKIINFNQTFFVDSFLGFRLTPLKKHWNNLANLSSDNIDMFSSGTFVDVIKFLLNTMDSLVYKVKVVINGDKFCVYNIKNKDAQLTKVAEGNTSLDLIINVLNACPNYIDVYVSGEENEAVNLLSNVFTNRLRIFLNNSSSI